MDRRTEKTMIDIFRRRGILSYQSNDQIGLSELGDPEYYSKLSQDYNDYSSSMSDYYKSDCIYQYSKYKDSDNYTPSLHSIMEYYIVYNSYYDNNYNAIIAETVPNVPFDYFVEVYIK